MEYNDLQDFLMDIAPNITNGYGDPRSNAAANRLGQVAILSVKGTRGHFRRVLGSNQRRLRCRVKLFKMAALPNPRGKASFATIVRLETPC